MLSSSLASDSQAAAAASIGSEPGPEYINAELTSGGSAAKSTPMNAAQPIEAALAASVIPYEAPL